MFIRWSTRKLSSSSAQRLFFNARCCLTLGRRLSCAEKWKLGFARWHSASGFHFLHFNAPPRGATSSKEKRIGYISFKCWCICVTRFSTGTALTRILTHTLGERAPTEWNIKRARASLLSTKKAPRALSLFAFSWKKRSISAAVKWTTLYLSGRKLCQNKI